MAQKLLRTSELIHPLSRSTCHEKRDSHLQMSGITIYFAMLVEALAAQIVRKIPTAVPGHSRQLCMQDVLSHQTDTWLGRMNQITQQVAPLHLLQSQLSQKQQPLHEDDHTEEPISHARLLILKHPV